MCYLDLISQLFIYKFFLYDAEYISRIDRYMNILYK